MNLFPDRRDDLTERRRRLRCLDGSLLGLCDFRGSLTFDELVDEVTTHDRTRDLRLSTATLQEWWSDTDQRLFLETVNTQAGSRWRLTDGGTACLQRARAEVFIDHRPLVIALQSLVRFMLPSVTGVCALVAAADQHPELTGSLLGWLAAIAICLIVAVGTLLATRPFWRWLGRSVDQVNANWLEGREISDPLMGWAGLHLPARHPTRLAVTTDPTQAARAPAK